jgi:hypothetical protein
LDRSPASGVRGDRRAARGRRSASDRLLDVHTQLEWLRELGFDDVDCYWKWLEMALLIGVKPAGSQELRHVHDTHVSGERP